MVMKTSIRLLFTTALLLCETILMAQQNPNLLPTTVSNFNIGNLGNGHTSNNLSFVNVTTDYGYVYAAQGLKPDNAVQHYAVGANARYYNYQQGTTPLGGGETGFFDLADHTNGSGNYMIVNGATNANKRVWEYTVSNLIPGVKYNFEAYVTCLFLVPIPILLGPYQPKLQLKINDVNVGGQFTVPWVDGGSWTPWTNTWTATSSTAKITIINNCTADNGNDFGLDDISFRMANGYSVTASNFGASFCYCQLPPSPNNYFTISLNGHYTCTNPDGTDVPSFLIQNLNGDFVNSGWNGSQIVYVPTSHGRCYYEYNSSTYPQIRYIPNTGYYGQDQITFRASKYGLTADATVTLNIADFPASPVLNMSTANPGNNGEYSLCVGDIGSFHPSATWSANGSSVTSNGWEWKASNSSNWNQSTSFNSSNVHVGNYLIQFWANNDCTTACDQVAVSDPITLRICDIPTLTSPTSLSQPPALCGANASLPTSYLQQIKVVEGTGWNNDIGTERWEVSHNNGTSWVPLAETSLNNNDKLRYHAFNQCGDVYSSNVVTISISNGPTFSQNTPSFNPYYCSGQQLLLPTAPNYNENGISVNDQYWAYSADGGITYTRINGNPTLTEAWDGRLICYVLEFNCGGAPSKAYSSPQQQLTVYGAPEFLESLTEIGHPFCVGDILTVNDLQVPLYSGSPDANGYWEISSGTSQSGFQPFTLPRQLTAGDNNKWIQYHTVGCGETISNAIQLQVNDVPTIPTPSVPAAICAGESFELTDPTIQNSGDLYDWGWQYSSTSNGNFVSFDNNEVPYSFNGYWIRYFAQNECGPNYSQPVQITVNDLPEVGDINTPPAICAGESLALTAPTVDWKHVNNGTGSWEIADPLVSEFEPLINNDIPYSYNGYQLRYKATNGCGTSYSSNLVTLTVYSTEPVYEDDIIACDELEHHGVMCTTNGDYNAVIQSPDGCDIVAYWHFELSDAYEAPTVRDTACNSFYWPRTHRNYYASGSYDTTIVSTNPLICDSVFTLEVVINQAPVITNVITQSQVQPICDGQDLNFPTPTVTWNYLGNDIEYEFWEVSSSANGDYAYFVLENVSYEYDQWWVRYHAINGCGDDRSDPVQISVRRSPVITTEVPEMTAVCEGEALPLPSMNVNWYGEPGTEGWYLANSSGNAIPINETTPMQYAFNDWTLYYQATNSCGDIISNERTISVNKAPSVPEIPSVSGVCAGGSFNLPDMSPEWNGNPGQGVWQIAETPTGPFVNLVNQNIPYDYNNWWLRYKATNACGSDTSRMTQVQVFPSDDLEKTMQACHPMHIYGFNCDHDGDYVKDSITEYGCEVTFTLHFSIGNQFEYPQEMAEGCGAYYWEKFHKWFDETQDFDTLISGGSAQACDTLYSIHVDISHPNPLVVAYESHCTSYFWEVNGVTYTESTIDTFYTSNGSCIDTLVLRLTIAPLEHENTVVMCQDYFWPVSNIWVPVGQTADTVLFDPESGCNVHYLLHVEEGSDIGGETDSLSTCEPFLWHGDYYQTSGVYTFDNVDPVTGCLTVDTLKLQVMGYSNFDILGSTQVAASTSYWPGVYHYSVDIDTQDPIHWQLLDVDWAYDSLATGKTCWVEVSSTGSARLVARLGDGGCNSDTIFINATQFAVDELAPLPLNIYPNPAKHQVTVESENIRQVKVYDMMGQLVRSYSGHNDQFVTVDVSEFSPSFYVIEVQTERGVVRSTLSVYR